DRVAAGPGAGRGGGRRRRDGQERGGHGERREGREGALGETHRPPPGRSAALTEILVSRRAGVNGRPKVAMAFSGRAACGRDASGRRRPALGGAVRNTASAAVTTARGLLVLSVMRGPGPVRPVGLGAVGVVAVLIRAAVRIGPVPA